MRSLVPVHGGLSAPVDRTLPLSRRKSLVDEAESLPTIAVAASDLATVHRWADGTLSPLTGPMTEAAFELALDEKVVMSGGRRYAWTVPMSLPVTDAEASALRVGGVAALLGPDGEVCGALEVASVFAWDKERYLERVYGTARSDHPGGAMTMEDERSVLVGGAIHALPPTPNPVYGHQVLSPLRTRALIADRRWERALAFQTRNPLHRAHEYVLVYGLEALTRAGHFAGAVLNPLVGELKGDDVNAATRMRCYNVLRDQELLGLGDVDPALWERVGYTLHEVFELVGLDIKMHYAGPSEAVMHAIYRQNHGFTDLVIGRGHAGATFADGAPIWDDLDAQAIFDDLPGELHIAPMNVGPAAYYERLGRVDLVSRHVDEAPVRISGSEVRATLMEGRRPDPRVIRAEVADILIAAYRGH